MPTYTPSQDGYINGGVWDESTTTMGGTVNNPMGFRFQLHTQFDAENRPIEPALVWPTFSMSLTTASAAPVDFSLFFRVVLKSAPAPYSSVLLPLTRPSVLLNDATTALARVDIPQGTLANTLVTMPNLDPSPIVQYLRHSSYNGYICISVSITHFSGSLIFHTSRATTSAYHPSISTLETPFTTGHLDGPSIGRRSRMRYCPRTGMPVASDAMVRDGWREGLMVSPEGWEPEDPRDRYVPSPNEGVVDDEV